MLGVYGAFVVTAQYSGLGLVESYLSFQDGSNIGNATALLFLTGITAGACSVLIRHLKRHYRRLKATYSLLFAFAAPSVAVFYPDAVVGAAVEHIKDNSRHSDLLMVLIVSGGLALLVATFLLAIDLGFRLWKQRHQP
ncbi:hypothetical protein RBS12_11555 [Sinomonas sp. ASV322]|nr:hypothetical protein [Sinomonas sp. ASV322]